MRNDTSREIELSKFSPMGDPMGFDELAETISRLKTLRDEERKTGGRPSRWALCVDGLERALEMTTTKYELLRDRYALLKRSNSQLADEVQWLRDQCDDLYPSGGGEEEPEKVRPDTRRYEDRWPR